MKTQSLQRCRARPEANLLGLKHRRTVVAHAIQLLEEITLMRLKRTPELTIFVSRLGRAA